MLEISGLAVSYGGEVALSDLDLHVNEGEVVGLVGPNGAGKTTTLSTITGTTRSSAGSISFCGEQIGDWSPERIVRAGISLVPEGRRIFASLTVYENLRLGASLYGGRIEPEVRRLVERFPVLERYWNAPAGKLSGGEQQQLAIARALLARPRLLLLDEPSLGLAPLVVDDMFDAIVDLRTEGTTVLLVEQNANRTLQLADRSYVLQTGRLVLSGTREELAARADLSVEDAYFGGAAAVQGET